MNALIPTLCILIFSIHTSLIGLSQPIPLPEHPRPDFERQHWINLNGSWQFRFDSLNEGLSQNWPEGKTTFPLSINVPFPWGSALSGVADKADIAWYQREITINPDWKGKRTFVTIGASDWHTTLWLDGHLLGTHQGGYTPFSVELTEWIKYGQAQKLVVRVDDARRDFTLYGKQGYGNARGIWQTIYLEARGKEYLEAIHFVPDINRQQVMVAAYLPEPAKTDLPLRLKISTPGGPLAVDTLISKGADKLEWSIPIPKPRLWELNDPYLYETTAILNHDDELKTYFGMRKISVTDLPGTEFPYITLNDKPVYLQLALDQSYHPEGFYTFPSDEFMRQEIELSKSIGLNGIRTHIKIDIPRKLYWADKLGLLVMADLPNSWGEPEHKMQHESEYTLREMIKRDFNHPSIFSWILFNETWGLRSLKKDGQGRENREYTPQTQLWVASMYYLAKSLDPTRLVEDNSICCGAGHTVTDINSFHDYLPGWQWDEHLKELTDKTFPGSTFQFEPGFTQGKQPKINSECGNVWGYDGSTGDVDWSWDYHRMINTFREFPEIAGWLYTEHHDVINEWNGYWRFDRSKKYTGLEEIMEGMTISDFHSPVYLSTGNDICLPAKAGEVIQIPLFISAMTGENHGAALKVFYQLDFLNAVGITSTLKKGEFTIPYKPWMQQALDPLSLEMPSHHGLATVKLWVRNEAGVILHHNFAHIEVESSTNLPGFTIFSTAPQNLVASQWSSKQWKILENKKINGAGKGYFEYAIPVPSGLKLSGIKESYFLIELSAKELFEKDKEGANLQGIDYMLGGKIAPSRNPNAYPMTDEVTFPSSIAVAVNGKRILTTVLADDPADHRGVLSWHHQLQDKKLREAGSYGYLVKVPISKADLKIAAKKGALHLKFETLGQGGIAVYGKQFGRYPLDPSLVIKY